MQQKTIVFYVFICDLQLARDKLAKRANKSQGYSIILCSVKTSVPLKPQYIYILKRQYLLAEFVVDNLSHTVIDSRKAANNADISGDQLNIGIGCEVGY